MPYPSSRNFKDRTPHMLARAGRVAAASVCGWLLLGANTFTDNLESRALMVHNTERARIGLAPLVWNESLERSAQAWADHLAATGRFEHAPDGAGEPQGENLWAGTNGYYTIEAMVGAWVREKQFFRPGTFPQNSTTGRIADVSHYTQIVWSDTRSVGCARATGSKEEVLVCRYAQAGNYVGEEPF